MTTIQTYTGRRFNLLKPRAVDINLVDIAHHLSLICRFTGASRYHYSVAQHSIVVATLLAGTPYQMEGLMHDAAEAYYGDASSPMKMAMRVDGKPSQYDRLIARCERQIAKKFGLFYPWPPAVHDADMKALALERRDALLPSVDVDWQRWNMPPVGMGQSIVQVTPEQAEQSFLNMFTFLRNQTDGEQGGSFPLIH
jgi:hypothetical protein